jgi:hypothetical protein
MNATLANDDGAVVQYLVRVVRQIENEIDLTKDVSDRCVDRGAIISRPSNDAGEFSVKCFWVVNKVIDMAGFISRTGVNQEV